MGPKFSFRNHINISHYTSHTIASPHNQTLSFPNTSLPVKATKGKQIHKYLYTERNRKQGGEEGT